jgi:putative transposase
VEKNKKKIIVFILDNLKAHKAEKTKIKAKELGIKLVFLSPYSPDLNPVKFIWETIKREVSVGFIQSKQHLRNIIKDEFSRIEGSFLLQKSG